MIVNRKYEKNKIKSFKKCIDFLSGIWYTFNRCEEHSSYKTEYAEVSELADEQD